MFQLKNKKNTEPLTDPNEGHPFRTQGVSVPQRERELEELPKTLFYAECKSKKKGYGKDYYDILANTYEEVLSFLVGELKYKAENVYEIKRRGSLVEATNIVAYKH